MICLLSWRLLLNQGWLRISSPLCKLGLCTSGILRACGEMHSYLCDYLEAADTCYSPALPFPHFFFTAAALLTTQHIYFTTEFNIQYATITSYYENLPDCFFLFVCFFRMGCPSELSQVKECWVSMFYFQLNNVAMFKWSLVWEKS